MPVHRHRIRVVAPLDRQLRFRSNDGTPLPEPVVRDGVREFAREWRDVPARAIEPSIPSWYEPRPYIDVSDIGSWQEVTRLVRPLYEASNGPGVEAVVAAIRGAGGSRAEQILRALQYVQSELRYTSLSNGMRRSAAAIPPTTSARSWSPPTPRTSP